LSAAVKRASLDRIWQTAVGLSPLHSGVKGSLMFHALWFDMQLFGRVDFARLQQYLELPRTNSGSQTLRYRSENDLGFGGLSAPEQQARRAQLFRSDNSSVLGGGSIFTKLSPANEQSLLVFALHRQQRAAGVEDATLGKALATGWMAHLNSEWAARTVARSVLTSPDLSARLSAADLDQQKTLLGAGALNQLRAQVQLEFASLDKSLRNPSVFRSADPVSLRVLVKAVPTLIVKIFQIHARNFLTKKVRSRGEHDTFGLARSKSNQLFVFPWL
jgi:hypothetical protein